MISLSFRLGLLSLFLIAFSSIAGANPQRLELSDKQIHELRVEAVARINSDRGREKLPPVALDDLASRVGDSHCKEVVERGVISHWSLDGRKPYMRYSWAGGRDAVAENLSYTSGNIHLEAERFSQNLNRLEDGFLNEKPPRDGHRRNILMRSHTHVGIGLSWSSDGLCYAQEFLDRYVSVEPIPTKAKLSDNLVIKGRVLSLAYNLYLIEIDYEPLPKPMSLFELQKTYEYSLPQNESYTLRPKAPEGLLYSDGKMGEITQSNSTFEAPIVFFKRKPGIYTIVVWVINQQNHIQATNISVKVTD